MKIEKNSSRACGDKEQVVFHCWSLYMEAAVIDKNLSIMVGCSDPVIPFWNKLDSCRCIER